MKKFLNKNLLPILIIVSISLLFGMSYSWWSSEKEGFNNGVLGLTEGKHRGPPGPRGYQGVRGGSGPRGPIGSRGPRGYMGPLGPRGTQGVDGPRGQAGQDGAIGPQGPQGIQGPQGPPGIVTGAEISANGITGKIGPAGPAGPAGSDGKNGKNGLRGARGVDGLRGQAGNNGQNGQDGQRGPIGPAGPAGSAGSAGSAGPTGLRGPTGLAGPTGPAGPKGTDSPWVKTNNHISYGNKKSFVGIGTNDPQVPLDITLETTTSPNNLDKTYPNTEVSNFGLRVSGNILASNIHTTSDRRVKDIKQCGFADCNINTKNSLDNVNKIKLVQYKFKDAYRNRYGGSGTYTVGVTGQQLESVLPSAVSRGPQVSFRDGENVTTINNLKTINNDRLITELIGAVQQLSTNIKKCKA
jgi:hypothetical protein